MSNFIDDKRITTELNRPRDLSRAHVEDILTKAKELKGISHDDVLTLLSIEDAELQMRLFQTAKEVKETIYGNRMVLFAPLYVSNLCYNECQYCAFRSSNKLLHRRALSQAEIRRETEVLIEQGHKRVLLVTGEDGSQRGLDYMVESIATVYDVKLAKGNIRRINVNMAPLSVEGFKRLGECKIGTYQIFQETYHHETYKKLHLKGPKADYDFRVSAIDRAFEGGIEDVGVGILFGLYDWKYEILALLHHIEHLEQKYGVGPHTISVPRMEPALGSEVSYHPPYPVDDISFKKIIATLRLAVPYTGMILSTRENREMRKMALALGVSQISAGSKTNPGGYQDDADHLPSDSGHEEQFSLGDTRPLEEVIQDIVSSGYVPSFCTGCYRKGRVGHDFMDLAKPGLIKKHCLPNAVFTFVEYLEDFAGPDLKTAGYQLIEQMLEKDISNPTFRQSVRNHMEEVRKGKRDLYY